MFNFFNLVRHLKAIGHLLKLRRQTLNNESRLKPGQLCFLVHVKYHQDQGKVVEVVRFERTHPTAGDVYRIKSRQPLNCQTISAGGKLVPNSHSFRTDPMCLRRQLIPITPPSDENTQIDTQTVQSTSDPMAPRIVPKDH